MKKRMIIGIAAAVLILLIGLAGYYLLPHGRVANVEIRIDPSASFTEGEIRSAMNVVKRKFWRDWQYCELTELYYEEDYNQKHAAAEARQFEAKEAIILRSTFEVGLLYDEGNMSSGDTYTKWCWVLTRDGIGGWQLQTWGYG